MFEIVKSKSSMILKLFVYQIAMSLFGAFVLTPFTSLNDSYRGYVYIASAVFSTLFYFSLVCYAVIEDGQKDCVSHNAGRIEGKPYTGFVYSLVSYFPTIVIVITHSVISILTETDSFSALKAILGTLLTKLFLMGTYWGFDAGIVVRGEAGQIVSGEKLLYLSDNNLFFVFFLVLLPLVSGVSYYLAFKGKVHVDTKVKERKK